MGHPNRETSERGNPFKPPPNPKLKPSERHNPLGRSRGQRRLWTCRRALCVALSPAPWRDRTIRLLPLANQHHPTTYRHLKNVTR